MIKVDIKENESIEKALKTFKYKVIKTKLIDNLKDKRQYKKKSVLKREQILKAKYRQKNQRES
jgi:small subunit ribosomal protein S21